MNLNKDKQINQNTTLTQSKSKNFERFHLVRANAARLPYEDSPGADWLTSIAAPVSADRGQVQQKANWRWHLPEIKKDCIG